MSLNVSGSFSDADSQAPGADVATGGYLAEASIRFLAGGWTEGLAERMAALGQPSFVEAVQEGLDHSMAVQRGLLHGRHLLLTDLLQKALGDGIEPRVAFKSLLVLTRQNTVRAGNFDMVYPRSWVYAALEAVESAAALNATPGDLVLVGFNVLSAAAAGAREDAAVAERADASHPGQDSQEGRVHGFPETKDWAGNNES